MHSASLAGRNVSRVLHLLWLRRGTSRTELA